MYARQWQEDLPQEEITCFTRKLHVFFSFQGNESSWGRPSYVRRWKTKRDHWAISSGCTRCAFSLKVEQLVQDGYIHAKYPKHHSLLASLSDDNHMQGILATRDLQPPLFGDAMRETQPGTTAVHFHVQHVSLKRGRRNHFNYIYNSRVGLQQKRFRSGSPCELCVHNLYILGVYLVHETPD